MSQEFQRDYLVRLPLPLAQLYGRAHNAKDSRSRHDNTFYLFEALVKLAAAPAIACYLHEIQLGGPRVAKLDQRTGSSGLALARPVGRHAPRAGPILRRAARCRHASARPSLGSAQPPPSRPAGLLALYRRIKNGPDGQPAGDQSCSLMQVLDALVQYRNGVFGHGAVRVRVLLRRGDGAAALPGRQRAAGRRCARPARPTRQPPGLPDRAADARRGPVEVGLRDLVGTQGERAGPLVLDRTQAAASSLPNRVAVLWPGRPVPLRLDPLLLYREGELADEVLFLNRDRNGRQVEYLSYTTGRHRSATAPPPRPWRRC